MAEGDEASLTRLDTSPTDLSSPSITGNYEKNGGNDLPTRSTGAVPRKNGFSYINNTFKPDLDCSKFSFLNENEQLIETDNTNPDSICRSKISSKKLDDIDFALIIDKTNDSTIIKLPSFSKINSEFRQPSLDIPGITDGIKNVPTKEGSLSSSFLLGDIQMDVLKASMDSQFASESSETAKTAEMIQLHNVLTEYIELKETLQKNNAAMRTHLSTFQKWQDEVRAQKEEQIQQINDFQETFARLRSKNLELRKELGYKIEQIKINEDIIRRDYFLTKILNSEKTGQIQAQTETLEQQHLDSFEYIRKLKTESEEKGRENRKVIEHEYLPVSEHNRIVSDLEKKLSETIAKNIELDEMRKKDLEEIKLLKEQLSSCREQSNINPSEVRVLQSINDERTCDSESSDKQYNVIDNQMAVFIAPQNCSNKDLEMEGISREQKEILNVEKQVILTDLSLSQNTN